MYFNWSCFEPDEGRDGNIGTTQADVTEGKEVEIRRQTGKNKAQILKYNGKDIPSIQTVLSEMLSTKMYRTFFVVSFVTGMLKECYFEKLILVGLDN